MKRSVGRSALAAASLLSASSCANSCAISRALYIAVVHNSGAPSRAEIERMDARADSLFRRVTPLRIVVLPVAVLGREIRYDSVAADTLAARLGRLNGIQARRSPEPVVLPLERQPNEAYLYWTRFQALAAEVAKHPPTDADAVVLMDVFGIPEKGNVGPVHVMMVTRSGEMSYGRLWNEKQSRYRQFMPHSLDDATRMVIADIREQWPGRASLAQISISPGRPR